MKAHGTDGTDGMTAEEFADIIINQLNMERTNDELQNELFEILGFDHFELIQTLLQHRLDIINASKRPSKAPLAILKGNFFTITHSCTY